jgi:hypothetical protein
MQTGRRGQRPAGIALFGGSAMTVIGKILTFLVFFLSIVFLGFAIRINMLNKDPKTHQSWRDVAENLRKTVKAMEDDLGQKDVENKALNADLDKRTKELALARDTAKNELDQEKDLRSTAEAEARQAKTAFMNEQVARKGLEDELKVRREVAVANQATIKQKDITIADYQARVTKAENEKIQNIVAADKFSKMAQSLEKQVTDLTKELEQERTRQFDRVPVPERSLIIRPPPDDVKGIIKSVSGDLVSISIGSDAGLLKGHTLEVFRLDPKAEYFGRIQIVDVQPHEAVGKLLSPKFAKKVQPNDQVASKILPSMPSR